MEWLYKNSSMENIEDLGPNAHGFVYKITHLSSQKTYIGKKNLYSRRNVKLGKKELIQIGEERKSKGMRGRAPSKKLVIKESDWLSYYSSNPIIKKLLKEEGPEAFSREIIKICFSKKELTYFETKYQFELGVLEQPDLYFNDNILGKFFTKDFVV